MQMKHAAQETTSPPRLPVAGEVAQFAERLAREAQFLAEQVNGKLYSVMTSDYQQPCEAESQDSIEYPPLFSELRVNLISINNALKAIEYAIARTEL